MIKKLLNKKYAYILGGLFVLGLFAYTTYCTPLAGDDWGYALNGMKGHPIQSAIEFYYGWSGRLFSELWGFVVAPRKWLWNIINPILFASIFIFAYKLADIKKKYVISALLIIAIMLTAQESLRMETYSWIMGTTYVIPLCLSLIYFYSIDKAFKDDIKPRWLYLNNLLLIVGCLMMENISATVVGSIFIIGVYAYFKKKELLKYLIINFVVALAAFTIMRVSPGSEYRLLRDSAAWNELSIIEKAIQAYPTFIDLTFIRNRYLIVLMSGVFFAFNLFSKVKNRKAVRIISGITMLSAIAVEMSFLLFSDNMLLDSEGLFSSVFWPWYCVVILTDLFVLIENEYDKAKAIILFVIAGTCSLVMLESPIFGDRSVIYTLYYLACLSAFIFERVDYDTVLEKKAVAVTCLFGLLLAGLIGLRTKTYIYKYTISRNAQIERLEIIEYYKNNPDVEEAWIPRFPIYTLHGIDIEPDDTYHLETFKEYFKLPQAADKIIFYVKDE